MIRNSNVVKKMAGLLFAVIAANTHAEIGVSENKILLGQSAAFTGPAAQLGIQMHLGAKAYFDHVNKSGGVYQRKIEIVTKDDKYEPALAAANTKELIEQSNVFALFGYVGTPTSNAALPIFSKENVPFFAPFTGAQSLREPFNRNIFNIRAGYFDETEHLIDQVVRMGMRRIAVFYQNDAYGKTGLDGVERALKKRNMAIVAKATVERNSDKVLDAATELFPSSPDAIIQISSYVSCAAFIKEMKQRNYTGQFLNVSFVGSQALADSLGVDGPGVVVSQVVPFPWHKANPTVAEYTRILDSAGIKGVNFSSLEGFIAAKVFVEGLRRAGPKLTREKLIVALETINPKNYDTGFDVNFNQNQHSGSIYVDMTVISKNAKFRN